MRQLMVDVKIASEVCVDDRRPNISNQALNLFHEVKKRKGVERVVGKFSKLNVADAKMHSSPLRGASTLIGIGIPRIDSYSSGTNAIGHKLYGNRISYLLVPSQGTSATQYFIVGMCG